MTTPNLAAMKSVLQERMQQYRVAYEARDLDQILALFADNGEFTAAPGEGERSERISLALASLGSVS